MKVWSRNGLIVVSAANIFLTYCGHDDVSKWKHYPRYWPFVREFTDPRWISHTKASDAELWCFLWSATKRLSKQSCGWRFETPSCPFWRHRNEDHQHNSNDGHDLIARRAGVSIQMTDDSAVEHISFPNNKTVFPLYTPWNGTCN